MNWYKIGQAQTAQFALNNPIVSYVVNLQKQINRKHDEIRQQMENEAQKRRQDINFLYSLPKEQRNRLNDSIYFLNKDLEQLYGEYTSLKQQIPDDISIPDMVFSGMSTVPETLPGPSLVKKKIGLSDLEKFYPKPKDVSDETYEQYSEDQDRVMYDLLQEYQRNIRKKGYRQNWKVVPKGRLQKIWMDFARLGFVRDWEGINEIADIMIENTQKIYNNNILTGHSTTDPYSLVEDMNDGKKVRRGYFDKLESFFDDEKGSWRISDYGIDKLTANALQLQQAESPEDKLLIIDRMLNIIHMRNDLSSWFVEGGQDTLWELAGDKVEASGKNWYKNIKTGRVYDKWYDDNWEYQEDEEDGRIVVQQPFFPDHKGIIEVNKRDDFKESLKRFERWRKKYLHQETKKGKG